MEWRLLSLTIFLVVFIISFTINDSSVVLPELAGGKTFRVPAGALWFNLTSSEPVKRFSLTEFYPDQSFVGQYDMKIEGKLFLEDHSPVCSVISRNLWNSSDAPHEMATSDGFHNTYTYSYSQPTVDDPDFSIQLELNAEAEITTQNPVKGWFLLDVVQDGVTNKPDDFTMPTPVDTTTTTITTTETTDSNSTQEVAFTSNFLCFVSLGVLFLLKKKFR
jgi:hypothetical protein